MRPGSQLRTSRDADRTGCCRSGVDPARRPGALQSSPPIRADLQGAPHGHSRSRLTRLIPAFGQRRLEHITLAEVEAYAADWRRKGNKARTVNRDLNLMSNIYNAALRRGLAHANPVVLVMRPRATETEWTILKPKVSAVERAFASLAACAEGEAADWLQQARVIFLVVTTLGLRRGEVLGLHGDTSI